jgi:dipeptidyl aminopeptidase/acylaminoacyl peptidase
MRSAKREGDEQSGICAPDRQGGDAQRVTKLAGGASAPVWSPDGRKLLVTTRVYAGTRSDSENRKVQEERKARKYNARTYDTFPIRHWDRWLEERQPTLVVQSLDPGAEPRDLLGGTAARGPRIWRATRQLGRVLDADWTPDGAAIVFAATGARPSGRANVGGVVAGECRRRRAAATTGPGPITQPNSSDGRRLPMADQMSNQWVYNATRLVQWSAAAGRAGGRNRGFDGSVDDYQVAADSRVFRAEQATITSCSSRRSNGTAVEVSKLEAGTYAGFSLGGDAAAPVIAAGWGSAVSPTEIGRVDAASGQWQALSDFNRARVAQIDWQPLQEFWFTSKRGRRIHSFVALPPGFDASRKYPLFVLIHGGPHTMYTDEFGLRWNYHLHARPGYVALHQVQ